MDSFLINHGLLGLFLASLLASTLVPFGSEWLLIALISQEVNITHAVAAATAGNFLGACITYWIGLAGSAYLIKKIFKINSESIERAHKLFTRYGSWSLLFSWLPIIGDPLCLISGSLRLNFGWFCLLVFSGKLARYLVVAMITEGII
jgi:membrane protein YqaA with SNARE-associated domain